MTMTAIGHRIRSVTADPAAKTLTLVWDDGSSTIKAMASLIGTRHIFKPLADAEFFRQARIINDGRGIAWGDDIDMCADALWFDAHPQENPFVSHSSAAE
jgi:hypothetical protein